MSAAAFAVSTGVVAASEIGDKTQLLALLLAARFRKPGPIVAGILIATLANHAAASALGAWVQRAVSPELLRWALGLSFFAVAAWTLKPDEAPDDTATPRASAFGVFGITTVAFFLAEMGDKTQIATVMLAAKYASVWWVTAGTTLGMLLANVPVVLLGDKLLHLVPLQWVRRIAAALFALLGVLVLAAGG
ncbi:MAG TPA: TMEM165/GDT1 family protein [Methylibium sp.]|uniref:TMEM165/GDT1 family protein n=1 Tax=Methylibium sp. TaxID=2067992 RepID=UPI002DB9CDD8|nr:TMEM165/GDT1 family protein [Methylibium sp.]HEU4457558.1 TMEM165/GDT1 family protein [Methylibium sp.]